MFKPILIILAVCCCTEGYAQKMIVLKKRRKSIQYFWEGGHFTFQLKDKRWLTGIITKITPDSFHLTQEIIRYNMIGTDTLRFSGAVIALRDIYALPTKKEQVTYGRDGEVKVILGHEKFVWVRNGFIFQVVGAGYVGLNVANDLINNEPPFARQHLNGLGIGAAAFVLGTLLHLQFYPHWRIGKRYHLQSIILPDKHAVTHYEAPLPFYPKFAGIFLP